jgi:hypothetical protein
MNTVKISVCVSPEERQVIKAQAAAAGLSLSQYMGTIALGSRLDHPRTLQSLYLKAGEALTLADLVLEQYRLPDRETGTDNLLGDLADLLVITTEIKALTKDLLP